MQTPKPSADNTTSKGPSTAIIPQYIMGAWSGVVPDPDTGDYRGFRFNFTKIDGTNAEGKLTLVQNDGPRPNFFKGVDYRFTATLDEKTNSLIIKWSEGNFRFSMASERSAVFIYKLGDIRLTKQ